MKRILTALLVLVLFGCSGGASNNEPATDNSLKVGMECNYAPFNWTQVESSDTALPISEVDYCDGYDVQIARTLGEALGRDVTIVKLDWDSLIPALDNGQIDLVIAGMTDTPERRESVDFTTPYYESQMVVIVRGDSDLTSITDIQQLSGRKVLGQINTTYDEIIDQIEGVEHLTPLANYPRMILSLQSGEADAITAELPVAVGVVSANPDLAIVYFEEGHGFDVDTSVSIAVKKGNTELLNSVQTALDAIDADTRLQLMLDATNRQPAVEE